jgi:NADPH:quinone reductase-like Zn-dependent oxidoreductase
MSQNETMRAIVHDEPGEPSVLHLAEVPRPAPLPTEVLVRVHAAGINPVDWQTVGGSGATALLGRPVRTPGWDVSGVVEAIGYGVTRFTVGDEVLGMPWFPRPASAYAEYVTAPSRHVVRKPARLSHTEAAALPLAALTAWQALVDTADVQPGQRVLIHAGAGGVGHLAVQLAKARGAHVIATASAGKHAFVAGLGADEVVDYRAVRFEEAIAPVDVVVDLIGGNTGEHSVAIVKRGGVLVEIPGTSPATVAAGRAAGVRVAQLLVEPDHAALEQITALVQADRLHVEIAGTFPLEQAATALAQGKAGGTQGKLVLTVV